MGHAPEKTSWHCRSAASLLKQRPAFLSWFAKFVCPQMVFLIERPICKPYNIFTALIEWGKCQLLIATFLSLFSPVENRFSSFLKTCKIFHIRLENRFLSRFLESRSQ
jgi:hypothetical protein